MKIVITGNISSIINLGRLLEFDDAMFKASSTLILSQLSDNFELYKTPGNWLIKLSFSVDSQISFQYLVSELNLSIKLGRQYSLESFLKALYDFLHHFTLISLFLNWKSIKLELLQIFFSILKK